MLHYNFYKTEHPSNQLLILLHGFISDSQTYMNHIEAFLTQCNVLTIDLPGHGKDDSPTDQIWDFPYITEQINRVLTQFEKYKFSLLGYSMGGRVALYYAIHGQYEIKQLILESTSPGIADEALRKERQAIDQARGRVLEIAGIEVFVNDWEKLPLFQTQYLLDDNKKQAMRRMRLAQNPNKLAKALRDYGTGHMPNLWGDIKYIKSDCFILAGELDEKFVNTAKKMAQEIKKYQIHIFKNVGHTIHVEDEAEFDTIVLGFLKEEQND
ncbi:2-succinyl-6-hydroxy-2,4-cyclohexadiene-1-carboxylate synthase [Staphylococcus hominis]|uniref:2-succinyl-6-hydroxy-2, 4-cyclohexadiene-1-carboxylate synthase n=1 Tax=Staphylococcus hominis TaxID=1290 RepID=UPI00287AD278|nr:2-succinyl-6-hydroxy-2,4-cyclohexadiene-1-carboxylate synthase [Staphylococcus hominis]MDS3904574.1 2-succinyl-6-hydroxy-2,4-cyclohexadiene-1-carboxylate synthase [Staphylococcus hominis]